MKIRGRALIIAVVVGLAVQIGRTLLSDAISLLSIPAETGLRGFLTLPAGESIGTLLACFFALIVDLGVGVLYAALAAREGDLTAGSGALGGGLTGAIEGLLAGLAGVLIIVLQGPTLGALRRDLPAQYIDEGVIAVAVASLFAGFGGICLATFRGAAGAAIGGTIGDSVFKPKAPTPAAQ